MSRRCVSVVRGGGGPQSAWRSWDTVLPLLCATHAMTAACATSRHWLSPMYFHATSSPVTQDLLFSHSLHFPTEKGEGQLSLSSICPGNYREVPALRAALPRVRNDTQPGSPQKGALLLSEGARPCPRPGTLAEIPASLCLHGKQRGKNLGAGKRSEKSPSDKRQNINLVKGKRRHRSDHRTVITDIM